MPKLTIKLEQLTCQTALNDKAGTLLGAAFSSYLCSDLRRVATLDTIKTVWPTLSKAEQEQARLFAAANSNKIWKQKLYRYWFLTTYKNLDSGRAYKTVGCSLEGPGVSIAQLRTVVKC